MLQNMPILAGGEMVRELIVERQRLAALFKKSAAKTCLLPVAGL